MVSDVSAVPYDGISSFPGSVPPVQSRGQRAVQLTAIGVIVVGPFIGLVAAVYLLWGHGIGLAHVLLGAFFYLLTGFGVTVGFHRCFTHRSFTGRPALRVALAVAASMSFQGDVISWVATHRRHHAFTDRPGRPALAVPVRDRPGRAAAWRPARARWVAVPE